MRRAKYPGYTGSSMDEGIRLFRKGYRQQSRKYGIIARVEGREMVGAIPRDRKEANEWSRRWHEENSALSDSHDQFEGVPDEVMAVIRKLTDASHRAGFRGIVDLVAVCVDNTGMEDGFDREIGYIRLPDEIPEPEDEWDFPEKPDFIQVFDRFGDKRHCSRERFRTMVVAE
jgi:hypothetical protein